MDYGVLSSYFDGAVAKNSLLLILIENAATSMNSTELRSSVPCLATMI